VDSLWAGESIEELTRAVTAQIVLLLLTTTVLDDMGGLTVWTWHQETQGLHHIAIVQCQVSYPVVHLHVRYRLKAKLKVHRPVSVEQQAQEAAAFQKLWQLGLL
jgi:hypothetical protein